MRIVLTVMVEGGLEAEPKLGEDTMVVAAQGDFAEDTVQGRRNPRPSEALRSDVAPDLRLCIASTPPAYQLKMLVTDKGRLKMVHSSTQRTKARTGHRVLPSAKVSLPLALRTAFAIVLGVVGFVALLVGDRAASDGAPSA